MSHGVPEELSRLLNEHGHRLVLFAQQWCESPEDVVQDAFVSLMRQEVEPTDPVAWLYRVVRNAAISASRSARTRARHEESAAANQPEWFTQLPGDQIDAQLAVAALQSMPMTLREAVVLRLWGSLSFEQIGELTDTSSSTAHRRYVEGLASLRNALRSSSEMRRSNVDQ